jgi:Lon protease-like protein
VVRAGTVGRPRQYCGQSCRQRAYESRTALQRGQLPDDAVVLSAEEHEDLADRLFQVRCAAEDVATALGEDADTRELADLVEVLVAAARSAERIR